MTIIGRLAILAVGIIAVLVVPAGVSAQGGKKAGKPPVNPYTAIGGRSPALNYFNITRNQIETRNLLNRQDAEMKSMEKRLGGLKGEGAAPTGLFEFTLPRTGHAVYYSNLSHYYGR